MRPQQGESFIETPVKQAAGNLKAAKRRTPSDPSTNPRKEPPNNPKKPPIRPPARRRPPIKEPPDSDESTTEKKPPAGDPPAKKPAIKAGLNNRTWLEKIKQSYCLNED
jgi:hypothetical protein